MKSNVDLTLNRDFPSDRIKKHVRTSSRIVSFLPENFQWIENGVIKEFFNSYNSSAYKDVLDFQNGVSIVNTGGRDMRKHKLYVRKALGTREICYECGEPIRIPWKRDKCPCYSYDDEKQSCRKQLGYPTIIK